MAHLDGPPTNIMVGWPCFVASQPWTNSTVAMRGHHSELCTTKELLPDLFFGHLDHSLSPSPVPPPRRHTRHHRITPSPGEHPLPSPRFWVLLQLHVDHHPAP
jgi:hypothetical protein